MAAAWTAIDKTGAHAVSTRWKRESLANAVRQATARLPARRGMGKITAKAVRMFPAPAGTIREVSYRDGLRLRVDLGQLHERSMYFSPQLYEFREIRLLREVLKSGQTFVDIGAHIGEYTLIAAGLVGPQGRVVAVEPDPITLERLRWNVESNGLANVDIVECAVSSHAGHATLHRNAAGNTGKNSLFKDESRKSEPIHIAIETMDAILEHAGVDHVDVVKIDIEGGETAALRGSRLLEQRPHPSVLVEISENHLARAGTSAAELLGLLEASGFACRPIGRENWFCSACGDDEKRSR